MDSQKQQTFARPVAQEKDRNSRAWLILLALLCFGVALWQPAKHALWSLRNRSVERDGASVPRESDCFVAISYEGVAKESEPTGRFITVDRFREHLEALRRAGYHPIGLKDVRDFYAEKRPLPSKAILVTFENNHKSTFFDTVRLLRSQRWHAVMGVVTGPVREWDDDVLLRPYLKDMALNAAWDLACESDKGTSLIPVDAHGSTLPFFSSPAWIAASNRTETLHEFTERIEEDHAQALFEFTNHLGVVPLAFFFPNGNYGQYGSGNWALREANLGTVARHYPLGFVLNRNALNTGSTDPRRLNRLSVPAAWGADELLHELELSWPVLNARTGAGDLIGHDRWVADWGLLHASDDAVTLLARPADDPRLTDDDATGGARAWITGSNLFFEGMFDLRFILVRGELHVYLRFAADDDYLRLVVTDTGHASISQCEPGAPVETLAEAVVETVSDFRSTHRLLVSLRDGLLFTSLDDKPLFEGPVKIDHASVDRSGLVGIGVWDPSPGLATLHILETHLRQRLDGMAVWTPSLARDPAHIARVLTSDAYRYAFIAPPWLDIYHGAPVVFPFPDDQALRIAARANHAGVYPTLALHADADFLSVVPTRIAGQLAEYGADGLFIDAQDFPPARMGDLRSSIAAIHAALEGTDRKIIVRVPLALQGELAAAQLASSFSGLRLANESGSPPPGVPASSMIAILPIAPPVEGEGATFSQIAADDSADEEPEESDDTPGGCLRLRAHGIRAYAEGDYDEAIRLWSRWAELEPDSAEVWAYLGNAWNRTRDTQRAVDAYAKALAIDPGQIDIALESARLLESSGRDKEGADLLDAYARAYPDNRRIAIAQALWLDRHTRRLEGRAILRRLVADDPSDIPTRLTLQSLLDAPSERYGNMHELLAQVSGGGDAQLLGFGRDVAAAELLTIPESTIFFDFIRNTATNSPRASVRSLYQSFLPFSESIVEDFDASRLSDRWVALGTPLTSIVGAYDLKAASNMAEAYLRLKNSELMRDGFIEVTLGESVGAFWLYARRSSRNLVRFGFDGDGTLRIQTWTDGELRTGDSRSWIRPAGDIILRLEIRGDGANGIVNGKPVFATPLPIPPDIAYGWWSVAPFSPELGIARARISRISAGPLNAGIAMLREPDVSRAADALDSLRPRSRELSAIAPVLFVQNPDGTLLTDPISDLMPYRMFCAYHRLRLVPVASLDFYSDVRPETLVDIIIKNRLSGLILQVRSMPSDAWFQRTTALLEKTSADLIVIQSDVTIWPAEPAASVEAETERLASIPPVTLRELERGSLLLPPIHASWKVPVTPFAKWESPDPNAPTVPTLVVIPQTHTEIE